MVHPIDTVKCRVQANVGPPGTPPMSAAAVVSDLVRRDGLLALYRGIGAPMVAYGLINAVAFSTNTMVTRYLRETWVEQGGRGGEREGGTVAGSSFNPWAVGLVGGAMAGLTSSFVRGPAERLKTVQQTAEMAGGGLPDRYQNTLRTMASLVREHGVARGLFTGTGATVVREVPQCAVYFLTYDGIRNACEKVVGREHATAGIVLAGGSAGVAQWVLTYPLDVVKSRIQACPPDTYKGVVDCAAKSLAAEGPLVFFRGIELALLRAFPLHASIFLTCELTHEVLANFREDLEDERRWMKKGGEF